jgi:hypothetical protein
LIAAITFFLIGFRSPEYIVSCLHNSQVYFVHVESLFVFVNTEQLLVSAFDASSVVIVHETPGTNRFEQC